MPSHRSRFTYMHVPVLDHVAEDLLRHFGAMFEFIDEGIKSGEPPNCAVRCIFSVARVCMFPSGLGFPHFPPNDLADAPPVAAGGLRG
jgi:hypothetical protein